MRCSRVLVVAAGILLLSNVPARAAHPLNLTVTPTCVPCEITLNISGKTNPNSAVTVLFVGIITTGSGAEYELQRSFQFNTDANGDFSGVISGITNPAGCTEIFTIHAEAALIINGVEDGLAIVDTSPQFCEQPPPGKTFGIGPSSMEGHLLIRPGDWISGGYSFKFVNGVHAASTVTVSSSLRLPFTCPQGGGSGGEIFINLGTHQHAVAANNTDWQPTGDANSILSWAGSAQAPDLCGGQVMDSKVGAIFEATVSQNPDTASLLNWRFKFRDPNAKGKGNVNCLDSTDPRRNKADVCGASWSQTVRDP